MAAGKNNMGKITLIIMAIIAVIFLYFLMENQKSYKAPANPVPVNAVSSIAPN